jgi:hypothetical protein
MIVGYILFLLVLVVDFFLYAIIMAYYDGDFERLDERYGIKNEKSTTKPVKK